MRTRDISITYDLTFTDVVDILKLVDASPATSRLDFSKGDLRIRLTRCGGPAAQPLHHVEQSAAPVHETAAEVTTSATDRAESTRSDSEPLGLSDGTAVKAPIMGVYYRAPEPGAQPFVEVGQFVTDDMVVGIIEVMKLMSNVKAGVNGKVVEFRVNDAEMVEFDQAILIVDEDAREESTS